MLNQKRLNTVLLACMTGSLGCGGGGGGGGDPTPETPQPVTNLAITPGDQQLRLTWTNPTNSAFSGLTIRRSTSAFPVGETYGTGVFTGVGTSYEDTSLTNGTTYYYSIFTYDDTPTYSAVTQASSIPNTTALIGRSLGDWGTGTATDNAGNVYVSGTTEGSLPGVENAGQTDIVLVKYNTTGVLQWARQSGTTDFDSATGVATDTAGNVYVAGETGGELDGETTQGSPDLFIIKYDSSGTKQWTELLASSGAESAAGIATDTIDNVYVIGNTYGGVDGNTSLGDEDFFLSKFNSAGVKQWTQQFGSTGKDHAYGLATDLSGNIFVVGITGAEMGGQSNAGFEDMFVVKYDSSGTLLWTRQLGTSELESAYAAATDAAGSVYVVGYTDNHIGGNTNARAGWADSFIAKYDANGALQWTRQDGTADVEYALGVATDDDGDIFVTGYTTGDLDGNTSAGVSDLFIQKYDTNGNKQWTQQTGSTQWDHGYGIATDPSGNILVAGDTFGNLNGSNHFGLEDLFVLQLNPVGAVQWTQQYGAAQEVIPGSPDVPTNLLLTATTSTRNDLSWTDNASDEDEFRIERRASETEAWVQIDTVSANTTNYSDIGIQGAQYYRVCASNSIGISAYTLSATNPSIQLSPAGISEDAPADTIVGTLSTSGFLNTLSQLSINGGATSEFRMSGATDVQLWQAQLLDYESFGHLRIHVYADDSSVSLTSTLQVQVEETPHFEIDADPKAEATGRPSIAVYGSNYFVVYRDESSGVSVFKGMRIDSTGQVLDPGGIDLGSTTGLGYGYFPGVAFDGTNFLVVWPDDDTEIHGVRVDTSGVVLDSTPIQITTGGSTKIRPVSIVFDGTNYMIAWRTLIDDIQVARVSTAGGILDNAAGFNIGRGFYPWIATNGSNCLVAWHKNGFFSLDVVANRISFAGAALDGTGFIVSDDPLDQDHVSVASDGTDYFVVWTDLQGGNGSGNATARGARVTGTGAVIDDPAILVATLSSGNVGMLYDGTDYVVSYNVDAGYILPTRLGDVFIQKVSPFGTLSGGPVSVVAATGHQAGPKSAFNGTDYLVCWKEVIPFSRDTGVWGTLIAK